MQSHTNTLFKDIGAIPQRYKTRNASKGLPLETRLGQKGAELEAVDPIISFSVLLAFFFLITCLHKFDKTHK